MDKQQVKIIIYDGVCGFCDKWVQFILQNKPDTALRFISFQSEKAMPYLDTYGITDINSIVFIEDNICHTKSTAIFRIVRYLDSNWKYLFYFRWVPTSIRDAVYDIIAKNRYSLFGKYESCRIPSKQERSFFID